MRRALLGVACVAVLVFAGSSAALAHGPHHGYGRADYGRWNGRDYHHHHHHHHAHRLPPRPVYRPHCGPVAAYPVYPAPVLAYPAYPRLGVGMGGSNFSLWYQQ